MFSIVVDKETADYDNNPRMTLDEYKRQREAKMKAVASVAPKLNIRVAGEGDDPRWWHKPEWIYRKPNIDHASRGESVEETVQNEAELSKPRQLPYASSDEDDQDPDEQIDDHPSSLLPQPTHTSTADKCQQTLGQHPYLHAQNGTNNSTSAGNYSPFFHVLLLYFRLRR